MATYSLPILKTERLILRRSMKKDLKQILFFRSDREMNKYIIRPLTKNIDEAEAWFDKVQKQVDHRETFDWAINENPDQVMIGTICLWDFSADKKRAEVGYALHPSFQGRGIMSEALRVVIDFGFRQLELDEIVAFTHRENLASIAMLLKHEFIHRPELIDKDNEFNNIYLLKRS